MTESEGSAAVFMASLHGGLSARPVHPHLEETLERIAREGRAAWPDLRLTAPTFLRHLAERIPPDVDLEEALAKLHAADLYLACACAQGCSGAVERFEHRYAEVISSSLSRVNSARSFIDEARQLLRHRLFVADDGAPAKIATYSGRGPLAGWIAIAAQRIGLNLVRGENAHDHTGDEAIAAALPAGIDPELDYLRARYRKEFREAFQVAITRLTERERMVLRLHLVSGLSHSQIASSYQVNQSTVTRWIRGARDTLLAEVQRHLRERLNVGTSELHSLAALVGSQLDLSLARWLDGDRE